MRSYTVKDNSIGSAVSEILPYRQIDKNTVTFIFKDKSQIRSSKLNMFELWPINMHVNNNRSIIK